MCGIVGYVGPRDCSDVLVSALQKLEYRGYDSAGIAVFDENDVITTVKTEGKLQNLRDKLQVVGKPQGHVGIGHTRWARNGAAWARITCVRWSPWASRHFSSSSVWRSTPCWCRVLPPNPTSLWPSGAAWAIRSCCALRSLRPAASQNPFSMHINQEGAGLLILTDNNKL